MPYANYGMCKCCVRQSTRYYVLRMLEEVIEWIKKPSLDEAGDVMVLASLTLYTLSNIEVILPFAQRSFDKGLERYNAHGCVRSKHNSCLKGG